MIAFLLLLSPLLQDEVRMASGALETGKLVSASLEAVVLKDVLDSEQSLKGSDVLEIRLQHEALATRFMTLVPNGAWLQRMPTVWAEIQTCVASLAAH